tara:strand:+ start:402 stop:836 length:435 start_codon:yes stop_codon:yes gene_type:complete
MSRKAVKTVSNEPTEFIPEIYKDLDRNAPKMEDRPLIFVGVKTNRDLSWELQDLIELKDPNDPSKGIKGMGKAYKRLWESIILEVKNYVTEENNKQVEIESVTGDDKNKLWEIQDDEFSACVTEAITHFYAASKLEESEVKTSD